MALAGRARYPRRKYPASSPQMPGSGPFQALAETGGHWNLAAPERSFRSAVQLPGTQAGGHALTWDFFMVHDVNNPIVTLTLLLGSWF